MRSTIIALGVVLLTGCSDPTYREQDYKVVCSVNDGRAYYVQPSAGSASFLRRSPELDKLCEGLKR